MTRAAEKPDGRDSQLKLHMSLRLALAVP